MKLLALWRAMQMSNNISISIGNDDYMLAIHGTSQNLDVVNQMALAAKKAADAVLYSYVDNVDKTVDNLRSTSVQSPTLKKEERPAFRDRLPNNVVDVKDLTIEKAVTENALVRCPKCGQAHCLAVPSNSHIYLMRRDYAKNEFGIIAEFSSLESDDFVNACCKPETDRNAYFNDLQGFTFIDNADFAVDNDTEIFCPVCCKSDDFREWKKAFNNPLGFFETEHLCDACGGEMLPQMVKSHSYQKCETCGHTSDYKGE